MLRKEDGMGGGGRKECDNMGRKTWGRERVEGDEGMTKLKTDVKNTNKKRWCIISVTT